MRCPNITAASVPTYLRAVRPRPLSDHPLHGTPSVQASPFEIALWNWQPLAVTLAVGIASAAVVARGMNRRPPDRTVLLSFVGALVTFGVAAGLTLNNSRNAHYDVANVDASSTLVLEVWQAAQVVGSGIVAAAALSGFVLLTLAVVASRRAV